METKKINNGKKVPFVFSLICIIIGIMVAIQLQATKDPVLNDTRDLNELRINLQKERDRSIQLMNEITKQESLLQQYVSLVDQDDLLNEIMLQELSRIKSRAGFEDKLGPGFLISLEEKDEKQIERSFFEPIIYDDDLRMLVNELRAYGAKAIAINGYRLTATSAIRNVGNRILIDTFPVRPPYEIHVLGDYSTIIPALRLSGIEEYFMVVNHVVQYEVFEQIDIPANRFVRSPIYLSPKKEGL
jgi:uncharacterized protein YlxW (UPF0749 family)